MVVLIKQAQPFSFLGLNFVYGEDIHIMEPFPPSDTQLGFGAHGESENEECVYDNTNFKQFYCSFATLGLIVHTHTCSGNTLLLGQHLSLIYEWSSPLKTGWNKVSVLYCTFLSPPPGFSECFCNKQLVLNYGQECLWWFWNKTQGNIGMGDIQQSCWTLIKECQKRLRGKWKTRHTPTLESCMVCRITLQLTQTRCFFCTTSFFLN